METNSPASNAPLADIIEDEVQWTIKIEKDGDLSDTSQETVEALPDFPSCTSFLRDDSDDDEELFNDLQPQLPVSNLRFA